MPSGQNSEEKGIITTVLVVFMVIGIFGGGQEADAGIVVTWFWMGIGLSVTYLLYRLLVTLEQIRDAL
ncbi:Mn2+/Fe2+ transporter [Halomontanus rarus]|uniref:Mn2+/Fe2+ transporter n=1 Tax=Halomontanus rarus TaxID=3034020 RepID=UPI0023E8077A|nr:Mn2+/Fe2+ transporter [Halovivax sp. TS33]